MHKREQKDTPVGIEANAKATSHIWDMNHNMINDKELNDMVELIIEHKGIVSTSDQPCSSTVLAIEVKA